MENVKESLNLVIDTVQGVIEGEKQSQKKDRAKLRKVNKFMSDIVELGLVSEDNTMADDLQAKVTERATELRILKKVLYRLNKCIDLINGEEIVEDGEVEEVEEEFEIPSFE